MRGFLISMFVLTVLTLATLEVVASHTVRAAAPLRSAATAIMYCQR